MNALATIGLALGATFVAIVLTLALRRLLTDTLAALSASAFIMAAALLYAGHAAPMAALITLPAHGLAWFGIHRADAKRQP